MKIIMIGSHLCQDTLYALYKLKEQNVTINFKNIATDFAVLKEYIKIYTENELYEEVRKNGKLGIPFFQLEDGGYTLNLEEVLEKL